MRLFLIACAAWLVGAAAPAGADTIDRVRAEGVLRCGGAIRPGLAFPAADRRWYGIEVDICRAVAAAVLGSPDKVAFEPYASPASYGPVRDGRHALFFLTTSELLGENLVGSVLPVVPVFYETHQIMVPANSPARQASDLAGMYVCMEPGTGPERSFEALRRSRKLDLHEFPFQETDEMVDAFAVGRCDGVVQELTSLAALRLQAPADHPPRILPDVMSVVPVFAATDVADGKWAAIVSWTVQTLMRAEPAQSGDARDRGASLPIAGLGLGLAKGWQTQALAAAGDYGAIYERNVGSGSPLDLPRGLNAAWSEHGLLAAAHTE